MTAQLAKDKHMVKPKRYRTAVLLCLLLTGFGETAAVYGQIVKKVGTSSAAFLRIPVGVKGVAMGSAFTSIADDGSALFWNPGNISRSDRPTLFVHHSPWLPGLDFNYLGFLLPVRRLGVFGVEVVSLASQEMDITTPEAPMGMGETFSAASTAVGIAYARSLTNRFSIGAAVKFINERIYNTNAAGVAFDVGTLFLTPFRDVRFGVSICNIGTRMQMGGEDLNTYVDVAPTQEGNNDNIVSQLKTDRFDLPIVMRIGLSWDRKITSGSRITVACDGVNPNDDSPYLNAGTEFAAFNELLVLRGGYNELFLADREKGLTLGAGFKIPRFAEMDLTLGYAYQEFHYLGAVNHFSMQIAF